LSQYPNIEVEIFEGSDKLAEIGAGIGLFPRTALVQRVRICCLNKHEFRNLGDYKEAWLGETVTPAY